MSWRIIVERLLSEKFNQTVELKRTVSVSGGSINDAYKVDTNAGLFFVKKNSASLYPGMFEKEAAGLEILAAANAIGVPEVITLGGESDISLLILRFIESKPKSPEFWDRFAEGLASLHRNRADYFGLDQDNYIGSLHQSNRKHNNWPDFFREERLEKQVKMARDSGKTGVEMVRAFDRFYVKLPELFPEEPPALIHGDLWGGNFMVGEKGEPVIIDPAVYYGHREMDLGMSQLFGGFDNAFYEAYQRYFPLEKGWQQRMDYCNLYPLMVHVNLFGGSYAGSVQAILRKF
jgi:fructosamine-3-kinase